jgi:hypothetical protein
MKINLKFQMCDKNYEGFEKWLFLPLCSLRNNSDFSIFDQKIDQQNGRQNGRHNGRQIGRQFDRTVEQRRKMCWQSCETTSTFSYQSRKHNTYFSVFELG